MSNAQADEVPFLSGMERKPEAVPEEPGWHETKVTVDGRKLFQGDGMMWQLLRKIRLALTMVAERGPEDYEAESDYERGMRAGARFGGYHEAPKNENNLKAVIIGCTVTLLSAFVLGAWKLSNDSAALRAEFNEWKQATTRWMDQNDRRLDRLETRRP
jgi:hypothetical protein